MQYLSGASENLPGNVFSSLGEYRHKVFSELLGWELQTHEGMELDQFDRSDTVYTVAQTDDGRVLGCARLLPTIRPYLLGDIFPQLLNGLPVPSTPDVWELSRFAAVDLEDKSANIAGQFSSEVAVDLLTKSIQTAASFGAKRLITVSPIGVERLLRRAGFHAHRAGPPMIIDGHPIFACWIEIDET